MEKKKKPKIGWGMLIIALVLAAYILPYTILSDIQAWYGSFLAWGIIGVSVIAANIMITKDWGE